MDTCGYYLVQCTGVPYTLQEEVQLTQYNPAVILGVRELFCYAKYLYAVPLEKQWFTWPPRDHTNFVRM